MSALTSLLVRDHVVPVKKIEEAIQRQVISGGELDTVLLELGAVPENVVSAYAAATVGLAPASRDEVMGVDRDVVRIVPREVAEQHRLVPLAAEGRRLTVASGRPLSGDVQRQLEFLLGMDLEVKIAPDVRVAAALAHHYAVELKPRMRRLIDRLSKQEPGELLEVSPLELNVAGDRGRRESSPKNTYARPATAARVPASGPSAVVAESKPEPMPVNAAPAHRVFPPLVAGTGAAAPGAQPAASVRVAPAETPPPRSQLVKRHRGPMSGQNAVDLLVQAETRDDILAVAFAFVRQFFDYTVMFVVHDELAEGLDAFGSGAPWQKVQKVAGSLTEPGVLRQVAELLVPCVSRLDESDADRRFARDLERTEQQPCIVLPVTIRQRVVVLFYGDRGGEDFGVSEMPELLEFIPRISEALQRLILQRKKRGDASSGSGGGGHWPSKTNTPRKTDATPPSGATASAPWGKAGDVEGEPGPSSASSEATAPASSPAGRVGGADRRRRSGHLDVIGVPRSAPPPPLVGQVIAISDPPPNPRRVTEHVPAPSSAPGITAVMARRDARAGSTGATTVVFGLPVEESMAGGEVDDDEPELIIAEAEPGELSMEDEEAPSSRSVGVYRHRGGFVDVMIPRKPMPRIPALRPDTNARARRGPNSVPSPDDDSGEDGAPPREPDESPPSAPRVEAVPKVIVSMGDGVEALVHALRGVSREDAEERVAQVVEVGSAALPMLVQTFPGRLWHERQTGKAPPSSPRDISAVAQALASFGDEAVPYLLSLFDHPSAEVRYYALLTASDISHRDLVVPLSLRLFDVDDEIAALAMQLLRKHRRFQRQCQEALDRVRSTARSPRADERQRVLALKALGDLRDARSLRVLLQLLDQGPSRLSKAAHESLVLLTRQDFGDSSKRWQPWVAENGSKNRIEWLIEALLHIDEEIRRAAGDELKQLTQEYYGYHPSLPRREREIAQRKYRAWWKTEGQRRFSSSP